MDEKAEKDSTSEIPVAWDPQEIQHLVNNRKKMDNEELQDFLKKDSELHEDLKEFGEWKGFTRWEERFIIQNHQVKKPAELAEELERENQEVKLKMRMMGINFEDNDRQG